MIRKHWFFSSGSMLFVCFVAVLTLTRAQNPNTQGPPQLPPVRKVPGITVADQYPRACVDCHLNYTDMKLDTRFSTLMSRWNEKVEPELLKKAQAWAPAGMVLKGKHPRMPGVLSDVPRKCLVCHTKTSKTAPPFAGMMHSFHLTGGEKNPFLTVFQGECTHCHKLNTATGQWTIPSAPEK